MIEADVGVIRYVLVVFKETVLCAGQFCEFPRYLLFRSPFRLPNNYSVSHSVSPDRLHAGFGHCEKRNRSLVAARIRRSQLEHFHQFSTLSVIFNDFHDSLKGFCETDAFRIFLHVSFCFMRQRATVRRTKSSVFVFCPVLHRKGTK